MQYIEAIENRLWTSADNLRANSNYASNEYFLPIVGLIFLRHAFSRYLALKDDIEASLPIDVYSPEEVETKTDLVYQHIFTRYPDAVHHVYA